LFGGEYDTCEKFCAAALKLGHVGGNVFVAFVFVTVIIAIGESCESEAGNGWFVDKATV
jgi:hypothetical protein